jgi:hypothetical protein
VSFVVDTSGRPEVETLRARTPEQDAAFLGPLRETLERWEFVPARKDGRAVRQVVHLAVKVLPRR